MELQQTVREAQQGDKAALERLVVAIQDPVYFLALRMLCNPEDAKDATQEIIINVITKLSTFEFKSAFKTWVYRVASNYLLNAKRLIAKDPCLSFDAFAQDLESDLEDAAAMRNAVEYPLLLNELRISCTMAMLLCLDRKHRMAYILGDIFELDHNEASEILGVTKNNYRQQLSRARGKIVAFTGRHCGLVSDTAPCSCERKLKGALRRQRIDGQNMLFAQLSPQTYAEIRVKIQETQGDLRTLTLQKSTPSMGCPEDFGRLIEQLLEQPS